MVELLLGIVLVVLLVVLGLLIAILKQSRQEPPTLDIEPFAQRVERLAESLRSSEREEFANLRKEVGEAQSLLRQELMKVMHDSRQETTKGREEAARTLEQRFDSLRSTLDRQLGEMRELNKSELEKMRGVVDEKLQGTLEKRLSESFSAVSERLEQVHQGLGQMQQMAGEVGSLKRIMTNVGQRGAWGEVRLEALLEQLLAPEQYGTNIQPDPNSSKRVEFAIRLPGSGSDDRPVWLPIDAKFPTKDYEQVLEAVDKGDMKGIDAAGKRLEAAVKLSAKEINTKYIHPPATTDFALLFLPSEGLFAEVLRRPGLTELLQREYRVTLVGPTTLSALLNSLQMGFRTLAIQKRTSEVWEILSGAKASFGKFGSALDVIGKRINSAASSVENARKSARKLERSLARVEQPGFQEREFSFDEPELDLVEAEAQGTVDIDESADEEASSA